MVQPLCLAQCAATSTVMAFLGWIQNSDHGLTGTPNFEEGPQELYSIHCPLQSCSGMSVLLAGKGSHSRVLIKLSASATEVLIISYGAKNVRSA